MTFYDVLRSVVIIIEENTPVFNKTQAKKKVNASDAIFRVDVNDVKPFLNPAGRLLADHFRYLQYMPRVLKTANQLLIEILLSLAMFQQFATRVRLVTRMPPCMRN